MRYLMNKLGPILGLLAFFGLIVALATSSPSCSSLTPEQRQQIQALSVPAASILSRAAVSQGWVQPGDVITIQRGVAVVVSEDKKETKLFKLAELGLETALDRGLLNAGDTVTVETPSQVTITSPPEGTLTPASTQPLPAIKPGELLPPPLPPVGG